MFQEDVASLGSLAPESCFYFGSVSGKVVHISAGAGVSSSHILLGLSWLLAKGAVSRKDGAQPALRKGVHSWGRMAPSQEGSRFSAQVSVAAVKIRPECDGNVFSGV